MTIGHPPQVFHHVNLTENLPTQPSPYERLGTLKADADPLANIERDLRETDAIIAHFEELAREPGEAQKQAHTMLKRMERKRGDILHLKAKWTQPCR